MHGRSWRLALGGLVALALGAGAPVALADTNLGTVAGLTYVRDDVPVTAAPSVLTGSAACPGTTHVAGGGITPLSVSNVNAQFWVNSSSAIDGRDPDHIRDDAWLARGFNRFGEDKAMQVYAICSAANVRYVTNHASAAAGAGAQAKAACPDGTHVAGGSARLSGSGDQAYLAVSFPYDSNDPGIAPDDGWQARAYNQGGPTKSLTVQAQCVAAQPRYVFVSSSSSFEGLTPTCPAGTHAMGAGGSIQGPASRSFLNAVFPRALSSGPPDDGFIVTVHRTDPSPIYRGEAICKA